MNRVYRNHYQLLGVDPTADKADLKEAFRRLSKVYHPDFNNNSKKSNDFFRFILNAYQTLSDDAARSEYDDFLEQSSFVRKFGKQDGRLLSADRDLCVYDILNLINLVLWDIDGIIVNKDLDTRAKEYLLIILTFLDKWILGPSGFPDYFMEARQKEGLDPRVYVSLLSGNSRVSSHLPYTGLSDYFYDVRRRSDRFISKFENVSVWNNESSNGLYEVIFEFHNLSIHYLAGLLKGDGVISEFEFSDPVYGF